VIVFDTDVVVCILGRQPPLALIRRIAELDPDDQATTSITVGELVRAAFRGHRPDLLLALLRSRLWPNLQVLPFDRGAAETYGELRADLDRRGVAIPDPELRIAAICVHRGAALATGTIRPYNEVAGLTLENPFSDPA
jgi:predicted nucleic acid-binding protein